MLSVTAVESAKETARFFLVGFMGAGKTTLGRRVAEKLGVAFIDLDERIEESSGMSVSEIFEKEGEEGFRRRESQALSRLLEAPEPFVAAAGGGAFTLAGNRQVMKSAGVVVWLDVPIEEILPRIEGGERPLWKTPQEARSLHERRREFYREAHHRLALDGAGIEEAVDRLYRLLLRCRRTS
jgi:shikimate kinase